MPYQGSRIVNRMLALHSLPLWGQHNKGANYVWPRGAQLKMSTRECSNLGENCSTIKRCQWYMYKAFFMPLISYFLEIYFYQQYKFDKNQTDKFYGTVLLWFKVEILVFLYSKGSKTFFTVDNYHFFNDLIAIAYVGLGFMFEIFWVSDL